MGKYYERFQEQKLELMAGIKFCSWKSDLKNSERRSRCSDGIVDIWTRQPRKYRENHL